MTKGSVPKVLLQFALPYLLANVLQALYGGADLFVVGQFDDPASVAGVAIGSQVMQTITGIILGLTTGTTILIGIATGAGNDRQAAATATVVSQGVSFMAALWFLHRRGFHFSFTRKDVRLNGGIAGKITALGAPIALQDALVNISFLIITVIVNQMGVIASAAVGVVEKIIVFAMLPPMAISSAVAAMTAQNFGAGLYGRMDSCLRSGITMALVFGISICVYSQFMPETLTSIFSKDAPVVSMAAEYLRGYSIDCIIVSFVFCINSYFSGQGNSIFPMIHSMIATFLFRIPLSWICSRADPGSLVWMGYAPPASTMVSLAICFWYLRRSRRRRKARQDSAPGISSISTS